MTRVLKLQKIESMERKLSESEIQAAILEFLRVQPNVFVKKLAVGVIPGRTNSMKGIPDLLVIVKQPNGKGDVWLLEVKRPGKHPSPEQKIFMETWKACGGNAAVVTSVDDVISLSFLPQREMFKRH